MHSTPPNSLSGKPGRWPCQQQLIHFFIFAALISSFGASWALGQAPSPQYPRMIGYLGILHPLITIDEKGSEANFNQYYVAGFPVGLNLWKTKQIGLSLEIVPIIRAENGTSRVANVLFHPGVLINLGHDFTFAGRMAFETSGRYGVTPVLNKIVKRGQTNSYFVAIPVPVRFGNNRPTSLTVGLQFGIVF